MALLMNPAFCIDILRKHLPTQDVAEVCPQRQQKDPQISHQRQQKNPQIYIIYMLSYNRRSICLCCVVTLLWRHSFERINFCDFDSYFITCLIADLENKQKAPSRYMYSCDRGHVSLQEIDALLIGFPASEPCCCVHLPTFSSSPGSNTCHLNFCARTVLLHTHAARFRIKILR